MTSHDEINQILSRLEGVTEQSTLQELKSICGDTFGAIFGVTPDATRLKDILGEAMEFDRALARAHRLEEFGDLMSALLTFSVEQDVSISERIRRTLIKIIGRKELYARRGNKADVAIFGGSLDPITEGHISAARVVLNSNLGIQKVLFMPAYEYFGAKTLTSPEIRAEMARLLPRIDPRMEYFDFEIANQLFSETANTMLRLLDSEFAQSNRFHFLISTELANNIPTWPRWEELTRLVPFITIPRIGYQPSLRNPWFLQPPHRYIDIADAPGLIETSSTEARGLYRTGEFQKASAIVPAPFHEFIMERKLYQLTA